MKRVLSVVLVAAILFSMQYSFVSAASDYELYRKATDKINEMNIPIQPQRYHVVKSGDK